MLIDRVPDAKCNIFCCPRNDQKNSVKPRRHRTVEIDISTLLPVIVQLEYLRLMEWVNCIGNFSEFEG